MSDIQNYRCTCLMSYAKANMPDPRNLNAVKPPGIESLPAFDMDAVLARLHTMPELTPGISLQEFHKHYRKVTNDIKREEAFYLGLDEVAQKEFEAFLERRCVSCGFHAYRRFQASYANLH